MLNCCRHFEMSSLLSTLLYIFLSKLDIGKMSYFQRMTLNDNFIQDIIIERNADSMAFNTLEHYACP